MAWKKTQAQFTRLIMKEIKSVNNCSYGLLIEMVRVNVFDDAGYIWVPYLPIFETPVIVMGVDPYEPSNVVESRYATKMINNNFYGNLQFTG